MGLAAILLGAASAPPSGGTISIEPTDEGAAPRPLAPAVSDAVGEALGAHGFTLLGDPGHSAYIAEVTFARTIVGTGSVKSSGGRAAAAPGLSGGAGGGVAIPLSSGRARSVALERFELALHIRDRRSALIVWHGAATTIRPRSGQDSIEGIVSSLSAAALRAYPDQPGIVSIP